MPEVLIAETLETLKVYVPKLVGASDKLALDIQSHNGNWSEVLIAYLEGIAWLASAVDGIQKLDSELLANVNMDLLVPIVTQLEDALELQDLVSLCDLLQYEMRPLLQSYDDTLQGVVH